MDYQQKIIDLNPRYHLLALEIVEKIKSLRDLVALLQSKSIENEKRIVAYEESLKTERAERNSVESLLKGYRQREVDLAKKEKEAERKDYELAFQRERANEIKEITMHIFKNPVFVKSGSSNKNVPVSNNGYVSSHSGNENNYETETIQ